MDVAPHFGRESSSSAVPLTSNGASELGAPDDATLLAWLGLPAPPTGPVAPGTVVKLGVVVLRDPAGVERACLRLWVQGGAVPFFGAELTDLESGSLVALATPRGTLGALWPTIERLAFGAAGRAD